MTNIWNHTDGGANKFCCVSDIYLLYCIFSWFDIFVDRTIGSTGHRKGVDDVIDARYKWVLKLAMGNILNTG